SIIDVVVIIVARCGPLLPGKLRSSKKTLLGRARRIACERLARSRMEDLRYLNALTASLKGALIPMIQQGLTLEAGVAVIPLQTVEVGVIASRVRLSGYVYETRSWLTAHGWGADVVCCSSEGLTSIAALLASAMLPFLRLRGR